MNKEQKTAVIEELSEKLANTPYFYITDASGMSVAQTNNFRRKCFENGLEYKVYKNTLIEKALDRVDSDYSALYGVLKGFSGVIFSPESGKLPAKMLKEFRKTSEKPLLKGAGIDSDVILGDSSLDMLANLKSKHEIIGDIIGLLQSPAKNVVSALQSSGQKLSGIVKTLSERQEA